MQIMMTMDDRSARILAEHGGPRGACEYAIHRAHGHYKRCIEDTDNAYLEAGETEAAHRVRVTEVQRAWRARRGAIAAALATFDPAVTAGLLDGIPDGAMIETARIFLRSLPAELPAW